MTRPRTTERRSRTERNNGSGNGAKRSRPSHAQLKFLSRGLDEPGGKLPIFDELGQEIDARTVRACIKAGWAEPWFANPLKPDWLVCKLTDAGRVVADGAAG